MIWQYKTLRGKEKLEHAKIELQFEQERAVRTRKCNCGKPCRANMCISCWENEIKELEENKFDEIRIR